MTDRLDMAKIEAGFMPNATLDDMMTVARQEAERLRRLNDLIDAIAGGRFSEGHAPLSVTSAGIIRGGVVTRFDTETHCHCGADYRGSDHCPDCACEQYESGDCGHVATGVTA